jgi:hypothetical protein
MGAHILATYVESRSIKTDPSTHDDAWVAGSGVASQQGAEQRDRELSDRERTAFPSGR